MFQTLAVRVLCAFLDKADLSVENRNTLSRKILKNLGALPLEETIGKNEAGELTVAGREVDMDKAKQLNSAANVALDNQAENLIREQVAYEAITNGVYKTTGDMGQLFMRAALWWEQEREKHLKFLAGRSS